MASIRISLSDWQVDVFLKKKQKFIIIPKGRRVGGTMGAASAAIIWMLKSNGLKILWGDTIHSNIDKYVARYFEPVLKENQIEYSYNKMAKQLTINGGWIDFRSADRPENWEGFGYDTVILNEAGIILKNEYLYSNSVLPMLLDNPASRLFAIGTPKGKYLRDGSEHPFYRLFKQAKENENYYTRTITPFESPFLRQQDIDNLIKEMTPFGDAVIKQEIYGEFIERDADVVFKEFEISEEFPEYLNWLSGLDFGYTKDPTALVRVAVDERTKAIFLDELLYTTKFANIDELSEAITNTPAKERLIIADSHGQQIAIIRELQKKGLNVKESKSKAVFEGIFKMLSYKIIVTKRSKNLISEMNTYSFIDRVGKLLEDRNNHAIDAARYAFEYVSMRSFNANYSFY